MIAVVLGPVVVVEAGTRGTDAVHECALLVGQVEFEHDGLLLGNAADSTVCSRTCQQLR
jgi:hypothetical protein